MTNKNIFTLLNIDTKHLAEALLMSFNDIIEDDCLGDMQAIMDSLGWEYSDRFYEGISEDEENDVPSYSNYLDC